jgi:hypothetical protein
MKEKWYGTVDRDLDGPDINSEERLLIFNSALKCFIRKQKD